MSEREVINVDDGQVSQVNQRTRDEQADKIDGLELMPRGTPIKETKKVLNTFNLPADGATPFETSKPNSIISGNNSRLSATKTSVISADTEVKGVVFSADNALKGSPLVHVKKGARAVFSGCTFRREAASNGGSLIKVDDGGEAVAVGCTFVNGENVFDNAGAQSSVQVVGSSKRNVANWGNVDTTAVF
tara:strand:- start:258 stop:824 length:567 start_codon:yes stop_codon:yes gene_type:complete